MTRQSVVAGLLQCEHDGLRGRIIEPISEEYFDDCSQYRQISSPACWWTRRISGLPFSAASSNESRSTCAALRAVMLPHMPVRGSVSFL